MGAVSPKIKETRSWTAKYKNFMLDDLKISWSHDFQASLQLWDIDHTLKGLKPYDYCQMQWLLHWPMYT